MTEAYDAANQKIAELLSFGVPEEDIYKHLAQSADPIHKDIVRNYAISRANTAAENAGAGNTTDSPSSTALGKSFLAKTIHDYPIESSLVGAVGAAALGAGGYALKERIKTNEELRRERIKASEPTSAAIQVQQDQLALAKEKFEFDKQKFAREEIAKSVADTAKKSAPTFAGGQTGYGPQNINFPMGVPVKPTPANIEASNLAERGGVNAAQNAAYEAQKVQKIAGAVAPVTTAVENGGSITNAIQKDIAPLVDSASSQLKTGSGFPAFAGKAPAVEDIAKFRMPAGGELGDLTKLPSNLAFAPGFGPGLNTARNTLGQEGAQALARQQGIPFGEDAATRARLAEFDQNRIGPALNREQRKAIGAPMPEPTSGIKMKAGAKALGRIGALMAITDLAKAETPKERQTAIGNVLLGLLPPAMDVGEAGAPTLSEKQREKQGEFALLGSPLYQTQEAKNYRQARKVGSGRGIAPPSAYQR